MKIAVPHEVSSMSRMQYISKGFCEPIGRINDSRYIFHFYVSLLFPVLYGEVLDIDIPRPSGGFVCVDDIDC